MGSLLEYACLLSHLNTIKNFSYTNHKYALIFEDDISLEFVKYWDTKISDIINNAPNDWEIIMLGYIIVKDKELPNLYYFNENGEINSTISYIIKNDAAKKYINKYYINNRFDITYTDMHQADYYLFTTFKTYCYKYPYFTYKFNNDSTIHSEHLEYHKKAKIYTIDTWNNKNKSKEIIIDVIDNINNSNKYNYILIILISILIIIIIIIIWQFIKNKL